MKVINVLFVFMIVSVIMLPGIAAAQYIVIHLESDAEMLEILSDTMYVAEGRIGDRGGAATFELDLGASSGAPATTAQYDWQSGVVEPFEITYNSSKGEVTFTLGGITLYYTTPYFDFDEIFVRTRAVNDLSDIVVADLVLDGVSIEDQSSATGPDDLDILWIHGANLNDGFTLTGNATLSWTGTPPTQSRLAFQVKVGKTSSIGIEESDWGRIKQIDN